MAAGIQLYQYEGCTLLPFWNWIILSHWKKYIKLKVKGYVYVCISLYQMYNIFSSIKRKSIENLVDINRYNTSLSVSVGYILPHNSQYIFNFYFMWRYWKEKWNCLLEVADGLLKRVKTVRTDIYCNWWTDYRKFSLLIVPCLKLSMILAYNWRSFSI